MPKRRWNRGLRRYLPLTWGALIALGVSFPVGAQGASEGHAKTVQCPSVERFKLDNGLEVELQRDTSLPLVAVVVSVEVGSRHDPKGYAGLAHYVEHLLFQGKTPEEHLLSRYRQLGASVVNAMTATDATTYFALLPAEQLERALWLEARKFAVGLSELTEQQAELEAEVVRREFALRKDMPGHIAQEIAAQARFEPIHPYYNITASDETLEALSLANARWFYEQLYSAETTRLVLVGDFVPAEARQLVEKYWSGLRAHNPSPSEGVKARPDLRHTLATREETCRYLTEGVVTPAPRQLDILVGYKAPSLALTWPVPPGQSVHAFLQTLRMWVSPLEAQLVNNGSIVSMSASGAERLVDRQVSLSFALAAGKDWQSTYSAVEKHYRQFVREQLTPTAIRVNEQRLELELALKEQSFLGRALQLAQPSCQPTSCREPNAVGREDIVAILKNLNPDSALLVTSRYDRRARGTAARVEVIR